MLIVATFLLAAGPVSPATAGAVPPEIEQHYREYNLVNAFSTAGERQTIASRAAPAGARLDRIARLMKRLAGRVEDIDPGMVAGRRPGDEMAFRSDLLRVTSWHTDATGDAAWATLDVAMLDRGSNVTLVGQFDSLAGEGRTPSLDALLAAAGDRLRIHNTEVHRWVRVDGSWRREAATLHFLAN
jgi:hypothetical protein